MTLQTPFGEQTKTIIAGLELFQRLLFSKKAGRGINLGHALLNFPGLLLVLQENHFPMTVDHT